MEISLVSSPLVGTTLPLPHSRLGICERSHRESEITGSINFTFQFHSPHPQTATDDATQSKWFWPIKLNFINLIPVSDLKLKFKTYICRTVTITMVKKCVKKVSRFYVENVVS